MEMKLIEELAGVMSRTAIEELEYSQAGTRIRLLRNATGHGAPAEVRPDSTQSATTPVTVAGSDAAPALTPSTSASLHSVVAGMSGTFHNAPALGEAPFVQVGDTVQEGQVLAVVEAMKMLNQIEADASGRIVRIVQTDGSAVMPTTVLFEIEPQGNKP